MADDEVMTVKDIARILKLNPQTVRNWIDRGELPALHVGRRVRIRRSDFDAMISAGYTGVRTDDPRPSIWDGEIGPPVVP